MRLRRADCARPGLVRKRHGRGFVYLDSFGGRVEDAQTLSRIDALVIPPAWSDVWICPWPNGHLQAVGTDAAGRRQYRYHDDWRQQRDRSKHDRVLEFAAALPQARTRMMEHLAQPGLTRDRVLACAARLLDVGFFRIGSEQYAEKHGTYGLATMRREHVTISGDIVTFDYVAKHQKHVVRSVVDEPVGDVVRALKRRRGGGPELLAYRSSGGWVDVKSSDINDYLHAALGLDFSAKYFRTWSATVYAAVGLAVSERSATSPSAAKRAVAYVVKETAGYLGNTPAVCRSSYIDPRVVDLFYDGITIADDLDLLGEGAGYGQLAFQGAIEAAVVDLLSGASLRRRRPRSALARAS